MFEFTFDEATGVLRMKVTGTWTLPEIERYGQEAGRRFAAARAEAGALRLLIDCSAGYICPADLVQPLARAGMQYIRQDDRTAVLVTSSLLKLQIKRMLGADGEPVGMFMSENAAITWLTAYQTGDRPAAVVTDQAGRGGEGLTMRPSPL